MRGLAWLEGWLGGAAGVLGIVAAFISSVTTAHTFVVTGDYLSYDSPLMRSALGPLLIRLVTGAPTITATLLFAGVLFGTWLDLNGARTPGRVLLLTCATLALLTPLLAISLISLNTIFPVMGLAIPALAAGVIACFRHDPDADPAQ